MNEILLNYFTVNIIELALSIGCQLVKSLQLVLEWSCWPSIYSINQILDILWLFNHMFTLIR